MTFRIEISSIARDTFPVYELDGYTPKSGETSFTTELYKDGVPQVIPVSIAEIGTSGEYFISFTPDSIGAWKVLVLSDYDKAWREADFEVVTQEAVAQLVVAFDDSIPRLYMEVWLDRRGQTVVSTELVSCEVEAFDKDALSLFVETSSSPKVDDHFSLQHDLGLTADRPYNLRVTVTDTQGTVVSFHGISTVS
jgi:hypothetical protein